MTEMSTKPGTEICTILSIGLSMCNCNVIWHNKLMPVALLFYYGLCLSIHISLYSVPFTLLWSVASIHIRYTSGTDPGIFVRGVQLSENFWQAKKKEKGGGEGERKKMEGCGGLFPAAEVHVWFESTYQTNIYIQVYFRGRGMVFCTIACPSLHNFTVLILSGRGSGGPPPEKFWLKHVKWCKIL